MRRDMLSFVPAALAGLLVAGALWSAIALGLDAARLRAGWRNLALLGELALPPELDVLDVAARGIVETLHIAFLGTVLGAIAALPLAVVASRNLVAGPVGAAARTLLALLRVMPALLWAIVFVMLIGLGPLAGVLATAVYTAGFLGKLQYEAIEGIDDGPLEAVRAIGLTRLQLVRHVAVPEAANALWSHTIFLLEYNVRHGTVLGVVGAGGIGYYLMGYLRFFQYDRALVLLGVVLAVVLVLDALSRLVRRRFLDAPDARGTGAGP